MSHKCNLSTSAVRDKVSARKPPIQPTPITPTSTVFTGRFPSYGGRIKIMMRRDVQCCTPYGQQASFSRRASSPEHCKTLPREARRPGEDLERERWCLCFLIRYARLAKTKS